MKSIGSSGIGPSCWSAAADVMDANAVIRRIVNMSCFIYLTSVLKNWDVFFHLSARSRENTCFACRSSQTGREIARRTEWNLVRGELFSVRALPAVTTNHLLRQRQFRSSKRTRRKPLELF